MSLVIVIILILLLVGALPMWPYARPYGYGYWPSGIVFIILIIVLLLWASGRGALL